MSRHPDQGRPRNGDSRRLPRRLVRRPDDLDLRGRRDIKPRQCTESTGLFAVIWARI